MDIVFDGYAEVKVTTEVKRVSKKKKKRSGSGESEHRVTYSSDLGDRLYFKFTSTLTASTCTYESTNGDQVDQAGRTWVHMGETAYGSSRPGHSVASIHQAAQHNLGLAVVSCDCSGDIPFNSVYSKQVQLPVV
ncbi:hypothetical protein [Kineococcus glutinatus]|uniref:Uncharacterized protein n=1 Tax=Kineococcus glutinatus TaxID=1070872 RepID=A0ABP9HFC5_9ACTN